MRWPMVALLLVALAASSLAGGPTPRIDAATRRGRTPLGFADQIFAQGTNVAREIGKVALRYAYQRLVDLVDVVELNVGIGPGVKAGAELGLVRVGLGLVEARRIGLDGRQLGSWQERNVAYGILPVSLLFAPFELARGAGETWEALAVWGFEAGSLGAERTEREEFATTTVLYHDARMVGPWHDRLPGDLCSLGAEVHLLVIGARARLKPAQLLDFLIGLVGGDMDEELRGWQRKPYGQ